MKKRMKTYILVCGLLAGLAAPVSASSEGMQITCQFQYFSEGSEEYGIVEALDAEGSLLWSYQTERYSRTELQRVSGIGTYDDQYFLCEGGMLIALDVADGAVLWENEEYEGTVSDYLFDEDGSLYLCGYYGPDLFHVSFAGETIRRVDSFREDYYWPFQMEFTEDNQIAITYEQGPNGEKSILYVSKEISSEEEDTGGDTAFSVDTAFSMEHLTDVYATSELSEYGMTHTAGSACDGDLTTAWVESASGNGIGESITLEFDQEYGISGINIWNGFQDSEDLYYKNSRLESLTLEFSDGSQLSCTLNDVQGKQTMKFSEAIDTNSVKIIIQSVYVGWKYEDTCISEISCY